MRKHQKKNNNLFYNLKKQIISNLNNNIKEYLIISIIFIIGIIIGVIMINNYNLDQKAQITEHITSFTQSIDSEYKIDFKSLLRDLVVKNSILVFLIWILSSTIIGIPIVFLAVFTRGFCFGFTVSSILLTYNTFKGVLFTCFSMLCQNIIIIPGIIIIAGSGVKLCRIIIKDRKKENIKLEMMKHTIKSFFVLLLFIFASFIETYISGTLLTVGIKMFV